MATRIKLKQNTTPGIVPAAASLEVAELAFNTGDGKLYGKLANGGVVLVQGSVSAAGSNTQVQFNDSGSPNGSSLMTFSKATGRLTVPSVGSGNSSVNVTINSTVIAVGNSTANVVVNSTWVDVGSNVDLTQMSLRVGNSTVNSLVTATNVLVSGTGSQSRVLESELRTANDTHSTTINRLRTFSNTPSFVASVGWIDPIGTMGVSVYTHNSASTAQRLDLTVDSTNSVVTHQIGVFRTTNSTGGGKMMFFQGTNTAVATINILSNSTGGEIKVGNSVFVSSMTDGGYVSVANAVVNSLGFHVGDALANASVNSTGVTVRAGANVGSLRAHDLTLSHSSGYTNVAVAQITVGNATHTMNITPRRITGGDGGTFYIDDAADDNLVLNKVGVESALIDFSPMPGNTEATAGIRMFRSTNSVLGGKLSILTSNNSTAEAITLKGNSTYGYVTVGSSGLNGYVVVGSNVVLFGSQDGGTIRVGNTTVNASVNSTCYSVANSTARAAVTPQGVTLDDDSANSHAVFGSGSFSVGNSSGNVAGNSTALLVGNSTVRSTINSTSYNFSNSTVSSQFGPGSARVGSNVVLGLTAVTVGNSTVNTAVNALAFTARGATLDATMNSSSIVLQNTTGRQATLSLNRFYIGNGTHNAQVLATEFTVANATGTVSIQPRNIYIGDNVNIGAVGFSYGNSTVNTLTNAVSVMVRTPTSIAQVNGQSVSIGNSTVNSIVNAQGVATGLVTVGNATVNASVNSTGFWVNGASAFADYYTETEVDSLLTGKADTSHAHTFDSITSKPTTLSGYGITDAAPLNTINTQANASYTFALSDANRTVEGSNASAQTFTVPPNSSVAFPVGARIDVVQLGAGQITIANGDGVTIRSDNGKTKIAKQYAGATLLKRATNEWFLIGNLSA